MEACESFRVALEHVRYGVRDIGIAAFLIRPQFDLEFISDGSNAVHALGGIRSGELLRQAGDMTAKRCDAVLDG